MNRHTASEAVLVFTGDSITAADRDLGSPESLGRGFVRIVAETLRARNGSTPARCLNTGIGGNRIRDLQRRWRDDVLRFAPHVITILVGINDVTRHYDTGDITTPGEFRDSYCRILETAERASARIVLIEPFLVPVATHQLSWLDELQAEIDIVRDLTTQFDARHVAAHAAFTRAAAATGPRPWCPDGVHPSRAGHQLLADEWLELDVLSGEPRDRAQEAMAPRSSD